MVLGVSDDPEALTGLTWRVLVSCGPEPICPILPYLVVRRLCLFSWVFKHTGLPPVTRYVLSGFSHVISINPIF